MDDEIRLGVLLPAGPDRAGSAPAAPVADAGVLFPVSGTREGDTVDEVVVKIRVSVTAPAEF
jgi:hypothetical protein